MPEGIKKRKRESKSAAEDAEASLDAMAIFKRHFESQFAPLKEAGTHKKAKKEREAPVEDEWAGLSDEEDLSDANNDERTPEVIEFNASRDPAAETTKLPKSILKSFMSSKPPSILPSATPEAQKRGKRGAPDDSDDDSAATEATLLKNDLALQRLLRESHLLDASAATLEATGRNRLKALESRVQSLGGRDITKQKMPMAARKGMDATKRAREAKRRAHAKEAGIVLEKETRVRKVTDREKTRDRGFGPSVGWFRNGTLVLSRRDVMDIEGRTGGSAKGGKGGGGGGGKGKGFKGKSGKAGKKR